jgi:hypothetical protein
MIHDTLIWTKRGWLNSEELIIGDTIISYNPSRNCTEYDKISYIKIDYITSAVFGLKTHSMNLAITPDHPFLIKNNIKKISERKTMDDVFLSSFNKPNTVLYTAGFEPYCVSQDLDDVAWSARVASSFGNVRYMPIEYSNTIWNIVEELGALEAQHWIDVFFHWTVLENGTYWSKATKLRNRQTRDMVYHIAPRAGFGTRFMPNPKRIGQWIIGLSTQNAPSIRRVNWYRDRIEGSFFNIKTKNGSFLARKTGGTFLCPCDIT